MSGPILWAPRRAVSFHVAAGRALGGGWYLVPMADWLAFDRELISGDFDWAHIYDGIFPARAGYVLLREKPLPDQEKRKKRPTVDECRQATGHARVEGTGFCACSHAMYIDGDSTDACEGDA